MWWRKRPHFYVLDAQGEPQPARDALVWGRWFQSADRRVALTDVGPGYVSTVFLGLDHNFAPDGPALLWETMIFDIPGLNYQDRYSSKDDALAGHAEAVAHAQLAIQVQGAHQP